MTARLSNLGPPPRTDEPREINRWLLNLYKILVETGLLTPWDKVQKTGSNLADLDTASHASLSGILPLDPTSTDAVLNKHLSNAQGKAWEDHRARTDNPHGTTASQVGADPAGTSSAHAILTTAHGSNGAVVGATDLSGHTGSSTVHGATGAVVGTTNVQTLSGKTLVMPYAETAVGITLGVENILKVTAAVTLVLPTAVGVAGRVYFVDNDHTGDTLVDTTGSETIEGAADLTISGQKCVALYSDGSNWRVLSAS